MSELSRLVDEHQLFDVSEMEQTLACNQDHGAALKVWVVMTTNYHCAEFVCIAIQPISYTT